MADKKHIADSMDGITKQVEMLKCQITDWYKEINVNAIKIEENREIMMKVPLMVQC